MGELESGFAALDARLAEIESEIVGLEARIGARGRLPVPAPMAPAPDELPAEPEIADLTVPAPRRAPAAESLTPAAAPNTRLGRRTVLIAAVAALALWGGIAWLSGGKASPTPRAPGASAETSPEVAPGAGFAPPVDLVEGEAYVRTIILAGGDLQVTHWIRSADPVTSLQLAVPSVPGLDQPSVRARAVVVVADGTRLAGPGTLAGAPLSFTPEGTSNLTVSYTLSGVIELSGPGSDRALARVTSLALDYGPGGSETVTRSVVGVEVFALACTSPSEPEPVPMVCGTEQDGAWQAELSGDDRGDLVMAQFDQE